MIVSFKCKYTQKIWNGEVVKKFPVQIQEVGRRKLRMLCAASSLNSLRSPPGNKLEALKGSRNGQYSIRINQQWRICFVWEKNHACNVEIVDYHK